MEMASEQLLAVSQDKAWAALNDPEILKTAIPGCESITLTAENEYEVALTAAVGPVKAKFKGKMRLADIEAPNSYKIQFEGQGGVAGHGKGSAAVTLAPVNANETMLSYSAQAQVGGKNRPDRLTAGRYGCQEDGQRVLHSFQRRAGAPLSRQRLNGKVPLT